MLSGLKVGRSCRRRFGRKEGPSWCRQHQDWRYHRKGCLRFLYAFVDCNVRLIDLSDYALLSCVPPPCTTWILPGRLEYDCGDPAPLTRISQVSMDHQGVTARPELRRAPSSFYTTRSRNRESWQMRLHLDLLQTEFLPSSCTRMSTSSALLQPC